jgi:DNA-binding protein H-NS
MTIELNTLSIADLRKISENIEKEFKSRQGKIYKEARAEVREVERKYGLTIEEILSGKRQSTPSAAPKASGSVMPKYRNPSNVEETWTGRGKKPLWLQSALSQGAALEQFLIS